jgi:hypothetical protein
VINLSSICGYAGFLDGLSPQAATTIEDYAETVG